MDLKAVDGVLKGWALQVWSSGYATGAQLVSNTREKQNCQYSTVQDRGLSLLNNIENIQRFQPVKLLVTKGLGNFF